MIGANMLLSKLDGGRDPPGVTLQRMLLAEGVVAGECTYYCFFTPETILNSRKWRYFIQDKCVDRLNALVIDEAHTVKMW